MAILDPVQLGVKPCDCGRLSNKIHCPHCGSYTIYGTIKKAVLADKITGELISHVIYRCRKCGQFFNDYEWQFECKAPKHISKSTRKLMELHSRFGLVNNGSVSNEIINNLPDDNSSAVVINKGKPFNENQMNELIIRAKKIKEDSDARKELAKKALENVTPLASSQTNELTED